MTVMTDAEILLLLIDFLISETEGAWAVIQLELFLREGGDAVSAFYLQPGGAKIAMLNGQSADDLARVARDFESLCAANLPDGEGSWTRCVLTIDADWEATFFFDSITPYDALTAQ
jgi:hypothetical protein